MTDSIEKLGIKKDSTIYRGIQEMLDQAGKEEAIEFLGLFIKYMMLETKGEYDAEQLYELFKSKQ